MGCVHFAIFDCNLQTHHVLFSVHKKVDVFWIVFSRLFHSSAKVQIVSKPFSYDPVFTECIDLCTNMLEIVAFGGICIPRCEGTCVLYEPRPGV